MPKKHPDAVGKTERIIQILRMLIEGQKLSLVELSDKFNMHERAIEHDIKNLRDSNIEIQVQEGRYSLADTRYFQRASFDDGEQLTLSVSLDMAGDISSSFKHKAERIKPKVLEPEYSSSYTVNSDPYEDIDIDSTYINIIEKAIQTKKALSFNYQEIDKTISPYKIINIDEYWCLFGREEEAQQFAVFYISDIKLPKILAINIDKKEEVDAIIDDIQTPLYKDKEKIEVEVEVDKAIADYFLRKKHLSSQKILEKYSDKSLRISFSVTDEEEVDNLIKSWLPHMKVIQPKSLADRIKRDLLEYIQYLD